MNISYKPIMPRQSIISKELIIKVKIDKINSECFQTYKNHNFHYIVFTNEPDNIYMFNVESNKNNLYGHSSFPQLDNNIYNRELHNERQNKQYAYQVKYSGNLGFDELGNFKYWNNSSGHYQPHAAHSIYVKLDNSKFKPHNLKLTWADKVSLNK